MYLGVIVKRPKETPVYCNKLTVKMKKLLLFLLVHWLLLLTPLLDPLFLPGEILRALPVECCSSYSHMFDDSLQLHGFQFHLYVFDPKLVFPTGTSPLDSRHIPNCLTDIFLGYLIAQN